MVVVDDFSVILSPNTGAQTTLPTVKTLGFIDVDIGDNAKIDRLLIQESGLRITGWSRLSPAKPFQVISSGFQKERAFYTFDLGAMFSTLARVNREPLA